MELLNNHGPTVLKSQIQGENQLYDEIERLMDNEQLQEAYQYVESHNNLRKEDPRFLLIAARVYKSLNLFGKEQSCLENLIAINPKNLHSYLLSECLSAQEEYPSALKLLHEILDVCPVGDPVHFDALKSMGNIYLKCGDIEAAEETYNKASRINCKDQGLIVNYGVLAIQRGEYDKAKEKFTEAIHINTKHDVAWVGLALVHRAFSDSDLARACLLRALDENANNKIAVLYYYQWSLEDGVDTRIDKLQNYLNVNPDDSEALKLYSSLKT